ncbi:enkurin domain-containing protein 1 [Denticeps clupeoides]|uniref:Enkurin domain-containing protein n=1 Tax=Denticeps clupeoides TaxID=299321 RepID=A0AAY4E1P9_9TELE|nr:enkurin domain-containing protein 1 [Denticeps clupeoides]XP_028853156.1 enkurin domain-containing protein 1 [Denticeps clupeoides]XP_028853157.1 enkurin domain-containing protein 1 [Denticeps clupeoides]XP_028853158.1 enkurin domain-containing protein 1 [Denticeps clupeoides]XP_028853159.1 enkurin domain-containing protein 1 [Denticeps clupeoides]
MCEGPSTICGPIPPDPSLFPEYYRRPSSARGRLEGNVDSGRAPLLSGPLAPDPVMHPGFYSARAPQPPRVGANAMHILERGQRGVVGSILKLEGIPMTPQTTKNKPPVRDFGKENVRRLREIQRKCREQEAQKERARPLPVKALWTSPKYKEVPSRVMTQSQESNPPKRPECQNFLRAHSQCGSGSRPQPRSSTPSRSTTPRDPNSEMLVRGRTIDFVSHNARTAGKMGLRRSQSLQDVRPPPTAEKGRVPQYLEERKEQWRREAEERRRNAPDPSAPAGHTLMPERERVTNLTKLKEAHSSLVSELQSLPVRTDTLNVRSRRAELDRRLSELEEAIKILSRDKVYVRTDS